VLFFIVVGIDHLLPATLGKGKQALDLLGRILQVVVHRNNIRSASVTHPCQYRVVLAIVSRQADKCDRHSRVLDQPAADFEAVIGAAILDQHDFVPPLDRKILDRVDEFGNALCPVIDRNHNRQGKARQSCFGVDRSLSIMRVAFFGGDRENRAAERKSRSSPQKRGFNARGPAARRQIEDQPAAFSQTPVELL